MEFLIPLIGLSIALIALIRGAEIVTSGAVSLGDGFGVRIHVRNTLMIGLGTSLPVAMIGVCAVLRDSSDIVLPYVVGSHIAGILLVLGFTALARVTLRLDTDTKRTEIPSFVLGTLLMVLALMDSSIDRLEAFFLIGTFLVYGGHLLQGNQEGESIRTPIRIQSVGYIIGGLAALAFGAVISIDMIERLASVLTIPIEFLAMTLLAVGTTFPSIIRAVRHARQHESSPVLGTILGSCISNALFVVGISGMLTPLTAHTGTMQVGLLFLLVASSILVVFVTMMHIRRFEGMMLLILFGFFLAKLILLL